MKKILAAVCICSVLLCGCQSQTAYLKPYTVVTASKTADAASMLNIEAWEGFAENLGVVSVEDSENGINQETLSQLDAKEIFLTGTTDKTVITAKNIYTQMPPASITKILTALVALETVQDLDQEVTLTDDVNVDVADAQVCGFKAGDKMTLKTLLYCMLIYSGNDAANAVASAVSGGDIPAFCDKMNAEAQRLGATQTHFVTPNGLDDPDHYTTAYDLYLIFQADIASQTFRDIISQAAYTCNVTGSSGVRTLTWTATNYYAQGKAAAPAGVHVIGGKTGTTDEAGSCVILYEEADNGKSYISIVMGAQNKDVLYADTTNLLQYGIIGN